MHLGRARQRKSPRERPARRWRDELDYWKGTIWRRIAQIGTCGSRPLPNNGTLWVHNNDDDDDDIYIYIYIYIYMVITQKHIDNT